MGCETTGFAISVVTGCPLRGVPLVLTVSGGSLSGGGVRSRGVRLCPMASLAATVARPCHERALEGAVLRRGARTVGRCPRNAHRPREGGSRGRRLGLPRSPRTGRPVEWGSAPNAMRVVPVVPGPRRCRSTRRAPAGRCWPPRRACRRTPRRSETRRGVRLATPRRRRRRRRRSAPGARRARGRQAPAAASCSASHARAASRRGVPSSGASRERTAVMTAPA